VSDRQRLESFVVQGALFLLILMKKYVKTNNHYFLLRHGQTVYQTKKVHFLYPWSEEEPIKLTGEGEKMIKSSAEKLKNENINLIFSSDTLIGSKVKPF
jgi:hypothetical protein